MKKIAMLVCFATAIIISGCTSVAATQGYRPAGSTEVPIQISGELFDFTNVRIYIDGTKVIDKRLSFFTGDGEFLSTYNNMQIAASCSTASSLMSSNVKCFVFINNERAATLTM